MTITPILRIVALIWCAAVVAGCASLPDTEFLSKRYSTESARFESARGPLSARQSAALLAQLKNKAGDLDILDRDVALEQEIVGNPLVVGNKVTLLQDGPATYDAMFAAIRNAKDHVDIESYIVEDDEIGQKFADLLLQRQQEGVQINLVYDAIGAFGTPKSYWDRLSQGGIQVLQFNPLGTKPLDFNHRDHRKLMVVDGSIAFLGGINISSVYSTGSFFSGRHETADLKRGWRDTDVEIEGPVVAQFQKLFMQTWQSQKGPDLAPKNYFPTLSSKGTDIVRAIGSSPDDPYSQMYLTLMAAITNAEKQVYLVNAYFVPDPQLLKALLDAAARGVDVRLILPSKSDSSLVFHASRSYYTELLKGGVKIYERDGAMLHVKTAIIDGVWSSVGSANLDWRSALDNDEINAVILGREFAQQMVAAFMRDIAASQAIVLDKWEHRPIVEHLKETTARLLGRLL